MCELIGPFGRLHMLTHSKRSESIAVIVVESGDPRTPYPPNFAVVVVERVPPPPKSRGGESIGCPIAVPPVM